MLNDVLNLVFPRTCPACKEELTQQEGAVCWACLSDIEETTFHERPLENELFFRFAGKVGLEGAAALFYFDKKGKLQKIISALKYHNLPFVGEFLGKYYGELLKGSEMMKEVEQILPVPLHRSRLAQRGYNQSEAFGRGLALSLGIPQEARNLRRRVKTVSQTKKSQTERWSNVEGVFELKRPVSGHVVLVDDVVTTGSTLEACIRTLQAQTEPPKSIRILSIAMARV